MVPLVESAAAVVGLRKLNLSAIFLEVHTEPVTVGTEIGAALGQCGHLNTHGRHEIGRWYKIRMMVVAYSRHIHAKLKQLTQLGSWCQLL